MVLRQLAKLEMGVRFPSLAPLNMEGSAMRKNEWIRKAELNGKILGTLVLPKPPHVGSKILLPGVKDSSNHSIHVKVVKIEDDCVYLKRT